MGTRKRPDTSAKPVRVRRETWYTYEIKYNPNATLLKYDIEVRREGGGFIVDPYVGSCLTLEGAHKSAQRYIDKKNHKLAAVSKFESEGLGEAR